MGAGSMVGRVMPVLCPSHRLACRPPLESSSLCLGYDLGPAEFLPKGRVMLEPKWVNIWDFAENEGHV
ncbi:MAG: hypothetical protein ACI9X0_002563 [Kiritimatiellia bacterium]|jgi:hypothetical protein